MKNLIWIATGLVLAVSVRGQDFTIGRSFQLNWTAGGTNVRALDEGFNNQLIQGKPFSATEERRSVQILGNGTRIENSQSNRLYRDSQGRTRVEDMNGRVAIWDPIGGFRAELNPTTKVARQTNRATDFGIVIGVVNQQSTPPLSGAGEVSETLKAQTINGVTAQRTRVTTTIPRGQIGNNREILVITERWVSNDLQMLVKSLNSDPRFGDTTYELTRIVQGPQDGWLFQIPSDYTVTGNAPGARSGGGRGAGPGGPAPTPPPGPGRSSGPAPRGGGRNGGPPNN